jgi:hypothetical protein
MAASANVAERVPEDRRLVVAAVIDLRTEDPEGAVKALAGAPAQGSTIRSGVV